MHDPHAPTDQQPENPDATSPTDEAPDPPDAEDVANAELPLDPAGPTEFGEAVDG